MADSQHRQNITSEVIGRMSNGEMVLLYHERPIGRIALHTDQSLELNEGYMVEGDQIYSIGQREIPKQDTENCDLGWC